VDKFTPINRTPRGLLDFLAIRSGGRNPQHLTEDMLPVFEMADWYKEAAVIECNATMPLIAANANAGFSSITSTFPANICSAAGAVVPSNEVWIVRPGSAYEWDFAVVAGQTHFGQLVARNLTSQAWRPMVSRYNGAFAQSNATIIVGGVHTVTDECWMHPGEAIQVYSMSIAAANNIASRVSLSVVRLRI
jgi:hypothetical protein